MMPHTFTVIKQIAEPFLMAVLFYTICILIAAAAGFVMYGIYAVLSL